MTPPHSTALMLHAARGRAQGSTADAFEVVHVSEARSLGVIGNVAIATWTRATPEALDQALQLAAPVVERCGGEFVYLA